MEMYSLRVAELRRQVTEIKEQRKSYLIEKTTNSSHYENVVENAKRRALYSDIELLRMEIEDNMMDEKTSGEFSAAATTAAASIDINQNKNTSKSPSPPAATPTSPLLPSTITRRTFSDAERGGIPVSITDSTTTTNNNNAKEMLLEALTAMGNTQTPPTHSHKKKTYSHRMTHHIP